VRLPEEMLVVVPQNVGAHFVPELSQLVLRPVGPRTGVPRALLIEGSHPGHQPRDRIVQCEFQMPDAGPGTEGPPDSSESSYQLPIETIRSSPGAAVVISTV
jgi:hypothetical protein